MKYAIFSDVHGNFDALSAVLADAPFQDADRKLYLGDAVGYGAEPSETLETIAEISHTMIAGNHDVVISSEERAQTDRFGNIPMQDWTRSQLSSQQSAFLSNLPKTETLDHIFCVHGSPERPDQWRYILDTSDADSGFGATRANLIFTGHTHVSAVFAEVEVKRFFAGVTRRVKQFRDPEVTLCPKFRYLINPGSVGQPRDGDPRAAYGIFDSETQRFTLHRVRYDTESACRKILGAGLPREIGERLKHGK